MSNRHRAGREGGTADRHLNLLSPTLAALKTTLGTPWVVENVVGARKLMCSPVTLSGGMFGLKVYRPRLFESSITLTTPPRRPAPVGVVAVYGKLDGRRIWTRTDGTSLFCVKTLDEGKRAMGVDWGVTWRELAESIPPSYTGYLGTQLLDVVCRSGRCADAA